MGMAASQARYLGLTARKTNVEYEGQQVNQARTALANQSANLFNQLLTLQVPTPPSTSDYTTLQYSYEDGTNAETITNMSQLVDDPDGYNYLVTHYHYADVYTGVQSNKKNPQVVMDTAGVQGTVPQADVVQNPDDNSYSINGVILTQYDPLNANQKNNFDKILQNYPDLSKEDINDIFTYTDADGLMHFTTRTDLDNAVAGTADANEYHVESGVPTYVGNCELSQYDPNDSVQKAAYEQICKEFPDSDFTNAAVGDIYTWQYQGQTYFACKSDLTNSAISALDPARPTENQNDLVQYTAQDIKTRVERQERAFVDLDENGRPYSIRYENSTATFALNTETITDDDAYNDAMNQYNYDMAVYEQEIQNINAQTEKIQQQDRTLELRLRQLDTEQEALQTEMEAVKKVIEKNIESTFKTFE